MTAEQEAEKRKRGIFMRLFAALRMTMRVLKWIGLVLLALLLIAAIIFQAPWKVITLLVIILLACTVLPKTLRKWFWLTVGAVVIALIIWVFLPDNNEGWRPYTFDEELAALETKRAIPDSENAAIIYNNLLKQQQKDQNEPNLPAGYYELTKTGPWSGKDHPEVSNWLRTQRSKIDTLLQASQIDKCRFPIYADIIRFDQRMDRLVAMRRWAYLLICAANNDLGEYRIDQGLEKQIAVLKMAKHQYQQPTMIDTLVGIALEALAIREFNKFIVTGDIAEEHLQIIEQALAKFEHDWKTVWPGILDYEKLLAKNRFAGSYEINSEGEIRMSRDPWAELRPLWKKQLESGQIPDPKTREQLKSKVYPGYLQKKLIKAKTIFGWFYMPSTPQEVAKFIDASYEKYYAMAKPDFNWRKKPKERKLSVTSIKFNYPHLIERLTGMLEKPYYRVHDLYLRVIADKKGCNLLMALRRYKNKAGHWPTSLDEIKNLTSAENFIDPHNNGPFVYKLTDDNFTLYSKGKNNVDENGKRKDGADDRLIWPPKSRKAEEKKADAEEQ